MVTAALALEVYPMNYYRISKFETRRFIQTTYPSVCRSDDCQVLLIKGSDDGVLHTDVSGISVTGQDLDAFCGDGVGDKLVCSANTGEGDVVTGLEWCHGQWVGNLEVGIRAVVRRAQCVCSGSWNTHRETAESWFEG